MTFDWKADREEYRWIAALGAITAMVFLLAIWAGLAAGLQPHEIIYAYCQAIWIQVPLALQLVAVMVVLRALVLRAFNPFRGLAGTIRNRFGSPALIVATVLPVLIVPLLMGSFGMLKMLMPLAREFSWDDWLANTDKLLFFGYQPWQLTHALFGGDFVTSYIDLAYAYWVVLLFLSVLCFALLAPRYERARFFLSFGASWLLIGVIGAYLFPSAGPCYANLVGAVAAPDFGPLMDRLKQIHEGGYYLQAYAWQDILWRAHSHRIYGFAFGISAMPSMHNAIAVLYALSLSRGHRLLRIAGWLYVALIFIGSIHLGWHYAIDGIGAGLMMWGVWAGAGIYLDRVGYTRAVMGGDAEAGIPDIPAEPVAA